jgi:hypothetical protein
MLFHLPEVSASFLIKGGIRALPETTFLQSLQIQVLRGLSLRVPVQWSGALHLMISF